MAPPQIESTTLINDHKMDEAQYPSGYNLHPELQSYSYDVALRAERNSTVAVLNNNYLSHVQANNPFQHGQFSTLTNVNDEQYSNVYEPWQPTPVLPSYYSLEEADLLAPSTGVEQSGNTILPTYDVGNAVPQLLSQSPSLGFPIDQTAEFFITTHRPTSVNERSNKSPDNLHGPIQTPEPNIYQECTQSFPSTDTYLSHVQANNPFQHGQFSTLTNVNDEQSSNVYEPWQATPVLHSYYALEEADLLAPSNRVEQSGNTIFPTYDVGNAVPQLLSQSPSLGLPIDQTAEFFITTRRPKSTNERSNQSPDNLHGPIQTPEPNICQECTQSFPSTAELERHAKSFHHSAFKCKCGNSYARLDNLKRHWDQTPKFSCPHCDQYTGANAFSREDHLIQHLRTYHRHRFSNSGDDNDTKTPHSTQFYCDWPNCTQQQRSFGMKSQYTTHMRRIHNYSPFPCLVQGCVKSAGKGYFREKDLLKHSQAVHSIKD